MARTKQTARMSTAGKAPRQQLPSMQALSQPGLSGVPPSWPAPDDDGGGEPAAAGAPPQQYYKVVTGSTVNEIQTDVNAEMVASWYPMGGVAVMSGGYFQAMVRDMPTSGSSRRRRKTRRGRK
jgi:hypothetical protein